ncbi:hypothetical protein D3C86_1689190 [compost metagenome]
MIELPQSLPLGTRRQTPSKVVSSVMNSPVSRTVPATPWASMYWPTRNGRSSTSMIPAAIFWSVPCSARPMARPAAPSMAMMLAVCTPNCDSTSTTVSTRTTHWATLASMGRSVSSTWVRWRPCLTARAARPESHQPAIRMASAARQFSPWLTANWVR